MATSVLKTADPALPVHPVHARSPDRGDAMVWAMTELMLAPVRAEPRMRRL